MFAEGATGILIKNGRGGAVVGKLDLQLVDDNDKQSWVRARAAFCGT